MPCSATTLARLVAAPDPAPPDAELLRVFTLTRTEAAFAELVRRHGPMVLATCRRVLGHAHDAEDAFQAVFLVLARKTNTIRGNLAGWLYGVAVRTARGVRVMRDRRRRHESIAASGRREPAVLSGDPELAAVIDEELAKLPEHYREALVLCELRGLSRKEAATELGIPEGTLSSRLAGAKRKLAVRLSARGLATAAVLVPLLAPAAVSADLIRSAVSVTRGTVGPLAGAAASAVLKGMLFDQLKVVALAAGVVLTAVCGTWAMTGPPGGIAPAPAPRQADAAARLVEQLGSPEFAQREGAAKELRELGVKAEPALRTALKSDSPEVRDRAAKVLGEIRADAREAFAKQFDPAKTEAYDHPVWKRYVAIAGDSRASRELFARIVANRKWLRTLDAADANPAAAAHTSRMGVAEIFRDFHNDPAKSPPWPCDRPEEVAYLLLLGSYADDPGTELTGDEVPPKSLRNTEYLGRGIIRGEGQIVHARGLPMGLQGEWLDTPKEINRPTIAGPSGSDRVFARLFAAWLAHRPTSSEVVPNAFRIAATYRATEILPIARRYAANDFEPKRDVPPLATITALELIAQLGTRADLPLFERHFGDETKVGAVDPPRNDGARDYYRPAPVTQTTQMRDVALGLALLLHGANPEDFGFVVRKDTFKLKDGRYTLPWSTQLHLGFDSEERRTAAFQKAKEWLARQPKDEPKKEEPKPDPAVAKFVEQLGSPEFAEREAAQKSLRELGLKARSALWAALKTDNPEIRKRATESLAAIRKDRLWAVFAKVAGEDRAAQDRFAMIVSSTRAADAIEAALDDPARTDELYRNRTAELLRIAAGHPPVDPDGKPSVPTTPDVWAPPAVPLGDIAGWMLLGSLQSGTSPWRAVTHEGWEGRLGSHVPFLPEDDYTSAKPIGEAYEARDATALKKLTAAWLAKRRENDMLRAGLALAVRYDIKDAVAAARVVLRDPKPTEISPWNLAAAAIFLGLHGTKDDRPLLARHVTDDRKYQAFLNLPKDFKPVGAVPTQEGRDLFCHVRDAIVVSMCKLADKKPEEFTFPPFPATKHPNGKPMSLASATKVGFKSKADRAAAFEKAAAWLKSFEPRGWLGALWPDESRK